VIYFISISTTTSPFPAIGKPIVPGLKMGHQFSCGVRRLRRLTAQRLAARGNLIKQREEWIVVITTTRNAVFIASFLASDRDRSICPPPPSPTLRGTRHRTSKSTLGARQATRNARRDAHLLSSTSQSVSQSVSSKWICKQIVFSHSIIEYGR
jgi:hypothetical protein